MKKFNLSKINSIALSLFGVVLSQKSFESTKSVERNLSKEEKLFSDYNVIIVPQARYAIEEIYSHIVKTKKTAKQLNATFYRAWNDVLSKTRFELLFDQIMHYSTTYGTNFEGDVAREKTPKLLLSGAFHQNNLARRTQGQLGGDLFEQKTMKSVLLDAMLKYNGWALMSSYMLRSAKDPIAFNPDDITEFNYVPVGSGMDYQLSYVFPTNYEIIGRFSTQNMHDDIKALTPDSKQYSLGVTKYLWEHAFKLQGEVTLSDLNYFDGSNKQNWYVRFQLEIGI